jgi:hypothetical protein
MPQGLELTAPVQDRPAGFGQVIPDRSVPGSRLTACRPSAAVLEPLCNAATSPAQSTGRSAGVASRVPRQRREVRPDIPSAYPDPDARGRSAHHGCHTRLVDSRVSVNRGSLSLPPCAIPRPGDTVTFYQNRARLSGTLLGHRHGGQPIVASSFGTPVDVDSFADIRAASRESLLPPNWRRLPSSAGMWRPTTDELTEFKRLLEGRTPPGPRYLDVVEEIYGRGRGASKSCFTRS